jgi:uncharacterized membrane protein
VNFALKPLIHILSIIYLYRCKLFWLLYIFICYGIDLTKYMENRKQRQNDHNNNKTIRVPGNQEGTSRKIAVAMSLRLFKADISVSVG